MVILSTGSLYTFGLNRVFALASEAGFDGLEVLVDGKQDTRDPAYLRRLSADYGLPVTALHSPFVPDIPGWPSDQLGRLKHTVKLAREMSVPLVVTHLPLRFHALILNSSLWGNRRLLLPLPLARRDAYHHFLLNGRIKELESSSGVIIAVENMPAHRFLGSRINFYRFNRRSDLTRFPHLTLDTTHLGTWGQNPTDAYRRLKERVVHVHLSNFDGNEHRLPDSGRLRLDDFLHCLARNRYKGKICVETSPEAFQSRDQSVLRAELKRTLAFCTEHFDTVRSDYTRSQMVA
jgi:sugar phosphate isomerase/epimerase